MPVVAHPMQQKMADLRRHVARLLAVYALGWIVAWVLATILLLALVDYLIHFQDPGIRMMASLAVIGVLGWAVYRYGYLARRGKLRDVEVAQRVQRRFPGLEDRLSSSIEFLSQSESDTQAGSAALRRAVILQTATELEGLDLAKVVEPGPARRAVLSAGLVCLVALALVVVDPVTAGVAIARLARPLGNDHWPKIHDLAFRDPLERIASGKAFEVELTDRGGQLPDVVRIHYRYEGQTNEEVESMHLLGGVMVARKESVIRPFQYRAEGGDDQSMPWHDLEVVEPPRVESLKVQLHPPGYTSWPVEVADRHIHALRGTRVEISGVASKRLSSVILHQENGPEISANVAADHYGFAISETAGQPLVIDKSGAYWFELTDETGLDGGADDRWEIRAVADSPPTVTIEQPSADIFVTPAAVVPLKILAKDDLAIHQIVLRYSRGDQVKPGADQTATELSPVEILLWSGPEAAEAAAAGLLAGRQVGDTQSIEHPWDLAALGLSPGEHVTFYAAATDYLPQSGSSPSRRLSIVTPQELEDRIVQRQAMLLGELSRALKMQQDARSQTTALEIQIREVGRLDQQHVDHAQGAQINQRQVARLLTSATEGIPAQIADLLADLENNKIDSPEIARRMQAVSQELNRLADGHLAPVERDLTAAIKGAQVQIAEPAAKPDERVGQSLATTGEHQDQVIQSLETILESLGQWDNYRRFGRDVAQLRRDQQQLETSTKELGQQTLGKEIKDLDRQQQAQLKTVESRQLELARRLDKLQQQLGETAGALEKDDPLAAATLADALELSRRQTISGQMRQSAGHMEKNQLGQSVQRQQQLGQDLEEMLMILANRREHELARLIKKLREAEQLLETLRRQEDGLKMKLDNAAQQADAQQQKRELERLSREQKQIQEQVQRLARQLERLQAEQAGKTAASAGKELGRSSQAGEQGDAAEAGAQADKAQKDLDEAQQQLAERRAQAEADLAREQIARLETALAGLRARQQRVLDDTQQLEQARAEQGQFNRNQVGRVHDLMGEQKSLKTETVGMTEKVASAEVFHLALESAGGHMARSADLLAGRDTGAVTQRAQQDALAKFDQVLEALKSPGSAQTDGSAGGNGGESKGKCRDLAEVRLLKLMQEDLNRRFKALVDTGPEDNPRERSRQAADLAAELAAEQRKLAELALSFVQQEDAQPGDELPELRLDDPRPKDQHPQEQRPKDQEQ